MSKTAYKIKIMALRGMSQIQLKETTVDDIDQIEVCKISSLFPLDRETDIEVWVEPFEVEAVGDED